MASSTINMRDFTNYHNFAVVGKASSSVTFPASYGNYTEVTITQSKSGWYPIGVVGWDVTSKFVYLQKCKLTNQSEGSATVTVRGVNGSGSDRDATITVYVLWIKI